MLTYVQVRLPYLRVLGITEVTGVGGRMTDSDFSPEEETKFRLMAAMPDLQVRGADLHSPEPFTSLLSMSLFS